MNMRTPVLVTTTEISTGKTSRRTIDHDNRDDRIWLGKHCYWAMRNGCEVTTIPAGQDGGPK